MREQWIRAKYDLKSFENKAEIWPPSEFVPRSKQAQQPAGEHNGYDEGWTEGGEGYYTDENAEGNYVPEETS